jgi:hypothetical protein
METLLKFIPVNLESFTGIKASAHRFFGDSPAPTAIEEIVPIKEPAPAVAKPSLAKSGFHQLEERAAALGVKMAQQGFIPMDNPYAGLNNRLEAVWSSSFGKYYAAVKKIEQPQDEENKASQPTTSRREVSLFRAV